MRVRVRLQRGLCADKNSERAVPELEVPDILALGMLVLILYKSLHQ